MTAQIIMFPGAHARPIDAEANDFPVGIQAAKAFVKMQYADLKLASADELARRHQRICDAWDIGIPFGTKGRNDEEELYRKHEDGFFRHCLSIGVPPQTVASAMAARGASKVAINSTFLEIGSRAGYRGWIGYAAFEEALAAGRDPMAQSVRTALRTHALREATSRVPRS